MHELSLALSLVEAVGDELPRLGDVRVCAVRIRVGPLSGVVREALAFAFDVAAADSSLAGARLEIEDAPLQAYCACCQAQHVLPAPNDLRCPACGASHLEITGGRELELIHLEVIDGAPHR
jgi:hydrogenase nickel incorporation protein HypA/HybF